MPTYVINGREVETDSILTEDEIDEIADFLGAAPEKTEQDKQVEENLAKQAQGFQPSVVVGIPGAGITIPVTAQRTQESVNEQTEERAKDVEQEEKYSPSITRTIAGLGAEIAIAEGMKATGTVGGAAAGGPFAPATAAIGYIGGAISGGALGSIAAQEIEGQPEINWGRVATSAILNLVPGTKITKGPKALRDISTALAKRPIATTAGVGAVAGPGGLAAERYYETGELPSSEEMVASGLLASTIGAGLGFTQQKMEPLLRRFAGKGSKEIQDLVNKGDSGAVAYVDALTANVDPSEFLTKENVVEFIGTLANTAKADIAPSRVLGEKATQAIRDAGNVAMAGREVGGILGAKVNDAIRKSSDPAAMQKFALDYLNGKTTTAPKELSGLAEDLSEAKRYIHEYQDGILQMHYNGQRPLPDLLVKKIEQSMADGDYVTRSYAFFGDAEYFPSKQATEELIDDLTTRPRVGIDNRKTIERIDPSGTKIEIDNPDFGKEIDLPPMSVKEAETYIAGLNAQKKSNPDEAHNWIYTQNAGILKEKKDISPALRKYLGEYETPGQQISETMSKLSRLVAYDEADFNISTILRDFGVLKLAGEGVENLQPIKLRRGVAHIGNQELYGPPELQVALNHLYASKADDGTMDAATKVINDLWQTSVSASKAVKTVLNPASYAANLWGSVSNMAGMGMNPLLGLGTGFKFAGGQFTGLAKKMPATTIQEFKRRKELGLIPPGLAFADIQAGLQAGKAGRLSQKIISPVGKAYSAADVALRNVAYENYKSQLLRQFPGADSRLVEEEAARFTNNTVQNYDFVSNNFKTLSRTGVPFAQFATFTAELMRNQYNQGKIIKKMMDGSYGEELSQKFGVPANQQAIKQEAGKRIAALATVYVSTTVAAQQAMEMLGLTREKEKALRESVLPEYAQNKPLIANHNPETGEIKWMNTSYLIPQQQLIGPFVAGFNGRSFGEAMKIGVEGIGEDIIGEGSFTMNSLVQALNNYDIEKGGPISTSPDPDRNRLDRADFFIQETFTPGFANEIEKFKTKGIGRTAQRLAGLRWNDTTIDKGFGFRAQQIKDSLNTARAEISFARNRLAEGRMSQEDFEAAYQKSNQAFRENGQVLSRHVQNLRTIGLNDSKIISLMRDKGIGSETALYAMDGITLDAPKVKRDTITDLYDDMITLTPRDREKSIRDMAKSDPTTARALREKHRQVMRDEKLNISEVEKAVRFLGSNDGTRARYIFTQMQRSNDPDGVLKNYQRKGLVPAEVFQDIKLMRENAKESY